MYQILLARDRISERNVLRLSSNISGSLGVRTLLSSDTGSSLNSWNVVEIIEGGSVWLVHSTLRTGFGKMYQSALQVGDRIEAIGSVSVAALGAPEDYEGRAFSRTVLDVDRNGRKLLIDHVLTPLLDTDSLLMAASRSAAIFAATERMEAALSAGGLRRPPPPPPPAADAPHRPLPDHSPATPRADGAGPDRRRSAGSDGWPADGGAYTEDYESESPRSFDSPRSADSLDDVILSLSQSVAPAAPLKPSWSDPRGDGAP